MATVRKVRTPLRAIGQVKRVKRRRGKNKGFDEEPEELPKRPDPSKVYLEDPIEIKQISDAMTMDVIDFWHYVYRAYWKGRLRICDGELMGKLLDCFDDLVQNKILAKVVTTRNFCRRDDGSSAHSLFNDEEKQFWEEKALHVRATFTYYGGTPIKKHRKVSFVPSPNTTFTPHIRHSLPIIKRKQDPFSTADPKGEAISKLNTQFTPFFPRLGWDSNITCHSNACEWFISPVPEDLATKCIKAAQDFLIVKEQFTDSETWRTVTSITFSRKETKHKMYRIVRGMKSFYTSSEFALYRYALEKRAEISKSKGLFTLRPRKKIEYVVATSRNPHLRRTVLPRVEIDTDRNSIVS